MLQVQMTIHLVVYLNFCPTFRRNPFRSFSYLKLKPCKLVDNKRKKINWEILDLSGFIVYE